MAYSTSIIKNTRNNKDVIGGINRQSNDSIDEIFKNFDFNNKEVLTVLGSSDQMIASYYYGAKNVDTFDRNIRAIYYYYFRKWLANSTDSSYPNFLNKSNVDLYLKIVKEVYPKSVYEAMAKKYWITALSSNFREYDYFEYSSYYKNFEFQKDEEFISKTLNRDINFTTMDMFKNVSLNKKYDIVILSNMLEYLDGDIESLKIVRNNLQALLNDGGHVICSYIANDHLDLNNIKEKSILTQEELQYEGYYTHYELLNGKTNDIGYSYTKKRTI